jgi:nucleotide-binding universal stress UspA family protein
MKRIVVGIDGSAQGWSALAEAAALAHATGASLQIAHISPPVPSLVADGYQMATSEWIDSQMLFARDVLREAVARVDGADVIKVESISRVGNAADALAELATADEVTMAVVGHRGRNLAARVFVGSVADRLVQISSKPVLVVH